MKEKENNFVNGVYSFKSLFMALKQNKYNIQIEINTTDEKKTQIYMNIFGCLITHYKDTLLMQDVCIFQLLPKYKRNHRSN